MASDLGVTLDDVHDLPGRIEWEDAAFTREADLAWADVLDPPAPKAFEPVQERRCYVVLEEPVPPDGVTLHVGSHPDYLWVELGRSRDGWARIAVGPDGALRILMCGDPTPEYLRYAADLAEYRAAQHAAGDRQRKLDAIKAAEEALFQTRTTQTIAINKARLAISDAEKVLEEAKREALIYTQKENNK